MLDLKPLPHRYTKADTGGILYSVMIEVYETVINGAKILSESPLWSAINDCVQARNEIQFSKAVIKYTQSLQILHQHNLRQQHNGI